jgi:hypothetical protein
LFNGDQVSASKTFSVRLEKFEFVKDSELESRIQKSLDEGFTKKEVIKALKDDGYDEQRIRRIFRDLESDSGQKPERQGDSTGKAGRPSQVKRGF